ncbi:MAG: hypothetical protein V8S95_12380 [Odoribacter sp.]
MNKIFTILVLWIGVLCLGCEDDPKFPDPGFDMLTDKQLTIRRDTAESYTIHLRVNAPAGIQTIQLLDGRTYDVIDDMTEYQGKTVFDFSHEIGFEGIDKTRDSVLIYTVRIVTENRRAYNSSFKINLLKLSVPEIALDGGNIIGTTAPLVVTRGKVTTGMNSIRSIRIFIDDTQMIELSGDEFKGVSEYNLEQIVPYDFETGKDYDLRIEITDSKDQIHNEFVTVKGIALKKPRLITYIRRGQAYATWEMTYDEQGRVKTIDCDNPNLGTVVNTTITYDTEGRVTLLEYLVASMNIGLTQTCTYDASGHLEKMVDASYYLNDPENITIRETLQNMIYRPDGTMNSFDVGITTFENLQYTDGFLPGEKIYTEKWDSRPGLMSLERRRVKSGFSPVLMPTYIEGLPPVVLTTNIYMFAELFKYKYVYSCELPGYGSTENLETADPPFPEYSYSCDENGQLQEFVYKEYPNNSYYWNTFRFEY